MKKIEYFLIAFLFILFAQTLLGQNNTNSPYTRFGYGEVVEGTPTELRGMGGVGLANRSMHTINAMNPASYTSVDSLTFMFDLGAAIRFSNFSAKDSLGNPISNKSFNANLEYITFRFPFSKWLAFSAGMLPYSFVGYNFIQRDTIPMRVATPEDAKNIGFRQSFNGTGGFSQVYGGLSVALLNHVSVGVNAYYLFGSIDNNRALVFDNSTYNTSVYANQIKATDFRLRYGVQLYNTFAEKHNVTLGFIYENRSKLDGTYTGKLNNVELKSNKEFELPQVFGLGLNYNYNDRLTIGVDYMRRNWKDATYFGKKDSLASTNKFGFGLEYIPNPVGRNKYSDHIRYRVGFNMQDQYFSPTIGKRANDFVVSLGIGLPTLTGKSLMNLALEYGKIGSNSLIREDYLKLSFSASINEYWFFKPKL